MKKYTVSTVIELPRHRVVALYDDPDNLYAWQDGLRSVERLRGDPGQPGARSRLVFQNGKHRIELFETITMRSLPDEILGLYEWSGGRNTLENRFVELGPERTRWDSTCDYRFSSLILKAMGLFFPGMLRRQNLKFLENFKAFAEKGRSVRRSASSEA